MNTSAFAHWFHEPYDRPADEAPSVQLFCFPYAGAGPSAYHGLCKALPAHIGPCVVRLPGRETTRHLPALTDIEDIIGQLTQAIRPRLGDGPVVFWGHSMGALLAFEVARRLGPRLGPQLLVVSGHKAPQLPLQRRPVPVEAMSDAQFVELLRRYGGMPQAILDNPEVLQLLLPQLRADFMAMDRYVHVPGQPLPCDLLCINGASDRLIEPQDALAWHEQTDGRFDAHWLPGAHFFIHESRAAFLQLVGQAIAEACTHSEAELPEGG